MILKVERREDIEVNEKEGATSFITEIYQGNNCRFNGKNAIIGNDEVLLTNYDLPDEITGKKNIHYELLNAYLMNDEGKTIERII